MPHKGVTEPESSPVPVAARPVGELPHAVQGVVDLRAERDRVECTVRSRERLLLRLGEDAGGRQAPGGRLGAVAALGDPAPRRTLAVSVRRGWKKCQYRRRTWWSASIWASAAREV